MFTKQPHNFRRVLRCRKNQCCIPVFVHSVDICTGLKQISYSHSVRIILRGFHQCSSPVSVHSFSVRSGVQCADDFEVFSFPAKDSELVIRHSVLFFGFGFGSDAFCFDWLKSFVIVFKFFGFSYGHQHIRVVFRIHPNYTRLQNVSGFHSVLCSDWVST